MLSLYLLLLLMAPPQLVDALRSARLPGAWASWLGFVGVPIAVGLGHLFLYPDSAAPRRLLDTAIVMAPAALLSVAVARWAPMALFIVLPLLAGGIGLSAWLIRRTWDRPSWRRRTAWGVIVAFLVCVISTQTSPQVLPRALGPLVVLTLGLGLAGLLIALAALRPVLATLYMAVCVVASVVWSASTPVRLTDPASYGSSRDYGLNDGFYAWLRARGDLASYRDAKRPYPVIIASAEGGGIYAAAHSYIALSAIRDACPNFGQHLFTTVGVSGGAVGTLLYAATTERSNNPTTVQPCQHRARSIDLRPVTADLLSPALANLLFLQVADFLVPGPRLLRDGGQTLTDSMLAMAPGNALLTAPLRTTWDLRGSSPATVFVSTDVSNGNRFVFSPLGSAGGDVAETFPSGTNVSARDIPANAAAVISARFPWLTATARLQVDENSYRVLADGGYFENSGSDTSLILIQEIRTLAKQSTSCKPDETLMIGDIDLCKCPLVVVSSFTDPIEWTGCSIPIFIAYVPMAGFVEGALGYSYGDTPNPGQSYLSDPMTTILRARTARDRLEAQRVRMAFSPDDPNFAQGMSADIGYYPQWLAVDDLALPLGWKLSPEGARSIEGYAASSRACRYNWNDYEAEGRSTGALDPTTGVRETTRADAIALDNGCSVRMLATLFDPTGKRPGIAIPSY
ncbi:MAG: hypothetical protein EOP62_11790 [Sphingomonadales bacterium]|nr:MAG: hypothetical protein EOP62_11790 [Sphingomonadales bacterium]